MNTRQLTPTEIRIRDAVNKLPGAASPEIGKAVGMSMSSASGYLTKLAADGFVDRKQDPNSGGTIRFLYYPLQPDGKQTCGAPLPPKASPSLVKRVTSLQDSKKAATFSVIGRSTSPKPRPEPKAELAPFGIEHALAGITNMMADNILAGVQERVLGGLVENVVEQVTATIADKVADQVAVAVDRAVSTAIANVEARIAAAFSAKAPVVQKAPDTKRPRIMVIGGTDAQNAEVEKEFGDSLDIRFVTSEQTKNPSSWRDRVNGVARVVVMTKWISHSAMDVIDKKKYVPVNGGMTDLKNRLTELYVELAK